MSVRQASRKQRPSETRAAQRTFAGAEKKRATKPQGRSPAPGGQRTSPKKSAAPLPKASGEKRAHAMLSLAAPPLGAGLSPALGGTVTGGVGAFAGGVKALEEVGRQSLTRLFGAGIDGTGAAVTKASSNSEGTDQAVESGDQNQAEPAPLTWDDIIPTQLLPDVLEKHPDLYQFPPSQTDKARWARYKDSHHPAKSKVRREQVNVAKVALFVDQQQMYHPRVDTDVPYSLIDLQQVIEAKKPFITYRVLSKQGLRRLNLDELNRLQIHHPRVVNTRSGLKHRLVIHPYLLVSDKYVPIEIPGLVPHSKTKAVGGVHWHAIVNVLEGLDANHIPLSEKQQQEIDALMNEDPGPPGPVRHLNPFDMEMLLNGSRVKVIYRKDNTNGGVDARQLDLAAVHKQLSAGAGTLRIFTEDELPYDVDVSRLLKSGGASIDSPSLAFIRTRENPILGRTELKYTPREFVDDFYFE